MALIDMGGYEDEEEQRRRWQPAPTAPPPAQTPVDKTTDPVGAVPLPPPLEPQPGPVVVPNPFPDKINIPSSRQTFGLNEGDTGNDNQPPPPQNTPQPSNGSNDGYAGSKGEAFNHGLEAIYQQFFGRGSDEAGYRKYVAMFDPNASDLGLGRVRQAVAGEAATHWGGSLQNQHGFGVDASDLEAFKQGRLSIAELQARMARRAGPTQSAGGRGGDADLNGDGVADQVTAAISNRQNPTFGNTGSANGFNTPQQSLSYNVPGTQFDDPYTRLLEEIAQNQLNLLKNPAPNPALDKLLSFLDTRFNELSSQPGYSNDELSLLRTQALEPLEADRAASQKRVLERTAARGMLPSSGLAELDSQGVDTEYDKLRGAVSRDLAVNAIGKRDQDLAQALGLGQLAGVTIPAQQRSEDQQRRSETLALGSLLYDLPRRALQDNLSVINGTPGSTDLFSQAVQLLNANTNQQAVNNQQNTQFWSSLGELFGNLFD